MTTRFRSALAAALLASPFGFVFAQSTDALPIPSVGAEFDVPGAHEMPDPAMNYKVVFDVAGGADQAGDLNPGLVAAARFVNTLAKHGVPAEHRQIAVVLHREGTEAALKSDTYRARHDGQDNPNIALIQNMRKAGIELHQCGQALIGRKIDPEAVLPEVQVDFWALTTLLKLQSNGYIRVGGG
jgi:intracellular sulfur oxidation DsrE/DsrF family protein